MTVGRLVVLGLATVASAGCHASGAAGDAATVLDAAIGGDAAVSSDAATVAADAAADGWVLPDDGGALPACARTVNVSDSATLKSAITAAQPGDCIVLADGDYTFPAITRQATAASPIVIRAQNTGKAGVATGNLVLKASAYVVIEGLDWTSSDNIQIVDCDHCRLTRCRIHPAKEVLNVDWVSLSGKTVYSRIDHNDFGPKTVLSNMLMLAGAGAQVVQYTLIDHNYFHDITRTTGNGWETIRAGLSNLALSSGFTVIEHNLFKNCDGDPETISVKQSDAIVRYNTLRTTAGEITLRHGNRNRVYGNYILGGSAPNTGGIRVCGSDHVIYDNYISDIAGPGVFLEGGESDATNVAGTDHYRVHNAQVVFNTIVNAAGIQNGGGQPFEPVDCVVADNLVQGPSGRLFTINGATNTTYQGNFANPIGGNAVGMTATAVEIRVVDPQLALAGELEKLTMGSPAIDASAGAYAFVTDDVEGDARDAHPDVGADEFSTAAPLRPPLTAADVGPAAP
jgi:hypothetical protein